MWLILVALGAAVTDVLSVGQFHKHVVTYTAGKLSLSRLWIFCIAYARAHAAMLALGLWGCWQSRGGRGSGLTWRYLVIAYAVAATCARQGSGQTYFIEAIAATCLAASSGMAALWSGTRRPWLAVGASLVVIGLLCEVRLGHETPRPPTPIQRAETKQLLGKLKRLGPPMLSEYNGLVLQAGGELLFQPYAFRMLATQGRWDEAVLVADILRQRFRAVVADRVARGRWTRRAYEALAASYGVEGEYRLYRHIGEARVQLLVPLRPRSAPGARAEPRPGSASRR